MANLLFRVYLKQEVIQVKQFTKGQVVLGRNTDLDIVLNHDLISPIHALVERRDAGFYLCDLGSESGVTYQGKKVLDVPIASGDEFVLGPYTVQFFEGIPKPKAPPMAVNAAESRASLSSAPKASARPLAELKVPGPEMTGAPSLGSPVDSLPTSVGPTPGTANNFSTNNASASYSSFRQGTFLPPSLFNSLSEILNPSSGPVVEVVVTWRERVINTYHFREPQVVTAGYDPESCIHLPPVNPAFKLIPVFVVGERVSILLFPGMSGELFNAQKTAKNFDVLKKEGRITQGADGRSFFLAQKELARIDIPNSQMALWVRYVPETPRAEFIPWLDFSPSEFTAMVVALVAAFLLYLYTQTFVPLEEPDDKIERIATFEIPKEKKHIPPAPIVEQPVPKPPEEPPKKPEPPKMTEPKPDKPKEVPKNKRPVEVAPKKTDEKKKPVLTSVKPQPQKSGEVTNPGGDLKPKKPKSESDVSKIGIFAHSGIQKSLEKSKDTGALTQVGSAAAQEAGERSNKPGAGLNVVTTKAGPGATGIGPIGIKNVGVSTPSAIRVETGTGMGISKASVNIVPGGEGESLPVGMDKEQIRKVVREHVNELRTCYERELNRDPNLSGKLVLKWEIKENGSVGKISVERRSDTIKNERLIKCCQDRLREWRFPQPPSGTIGIVSYPFIFTPTN